jgi:acyl-coenzyme A synthetase/AMP-(fatty) acid ligase
VGIRADDILFSIPRLFSCVALEWVFFFPALVGGAGLLCRARPGPAEIPEILRADRPTVVVAPVTFYARMLRWAEEQNQSFDLSSVRLWMTGMEPLPPALAAEWRKRFGRSLVSHLGSTEAMMYVITRAGEELPGSVGKPVEGYDVKLVGDDGREVPTGEIGTLWIRAETVGHYWKNRAAGLKVFHGDWFNTGDRYYQDAQENLTFVGRADEMLRISGLWVAPSEVDDLLRGHPAVDDAALVGVPDEQGVLKGVAFVVPRDHRAIASGALEGELREFARARLTHYKVPREIVFVSELPRTASGKVQRFKLLDQYRGRERRTR